MWMRSSRNREGQSLQRTERVITMSWMIAASVVAALSISLICGLG
jgi:hypothetical protein